MSDYSDVMHGLNLVEAAGSRADRDTLVRAVAQDLMEENPEFKVLMQVFGPVRERVPKMGAVMLQELIAKISMLLVEVEGGG